MKVAAIIAEYNPFHKGHLYQINEAKKKYNIDYVIAIMSGCFTQRGIPSIYDKYTKAEMALKGGVDLCIELPTVYSTASAEFFARGGVEIANKLGIVDYLLFSQESGSVGKLEQISDVLIKEPKEYSNILKLNLEKGLTFPAARSMAIQGVLGDEFADLLKEPNNTLGIEYIKALKVINSNISPISIKRLGASHNSLSIDKEACSSSAIRELLKSNTSISEGKQVLPDTSYEIIEKSINNSIYPLYINDFSSFLHYKLLSDSNYQNYFDVSKELSDKISKSIYDYKDIESFIMLLKTKEVTYSRISRALLHILLNIKSSDITPIEYATVLGFNKKSQNLLNEIKKSNQITLISKNADYKTLLSSRESAITMFEKDILSNDIYESILMDKFSKKPITLFRKSPIIL